MTSFIDDISAPHYLSVSFITFMASSEKDYVLENVDQKLGFQKTPPLVEKKQQLFPKI